MNPIHAWVILSNLSNSSNWTKVSSIRKNLLTRVTGEQSELEITHTTGGLTQINEWSIHVVHPSDSKKKNTAKEQELFRQREETRHAVE